MNTNLFRERSADAEVTLICAHARLREAQAAAILGVHYDADELDRLILAYRDARRDAEQARLAWQYMKRQQAGQPVRLGPPVTFATAA